MANSKNSHPKGSKSVAKRGFTLIEVITAIAMSAVVMGVIVTALLGGWKAERTQDVTSQLQRSSRITADQIVELGEMASSVAASATDSSGNSYQTSASTLVLRLQPVSADGTLLVGDDYLIFRLRPASPNIIERIVISSVGVRQTWSSTFSLNTLAGTIALRYYNSADVELIPNSDNLTATKRLTLVVTSSDATLGQTISRSFTGHMLLRNKSQ